MALILNIETATKACSVGLAKDGQIISLKEQVDEQYAHAENLNLFIREAMDQAQTNLADLDAIAISKGPGSYTGLRIGVSTVKGLCYALDKPMLAISTLRALCNAPLPADAALLCPMIDARRMEVFTTLFDRNGNEVLPTEARIIDENSYAAELTGSKIVFFGNGAAKCREAITHPNALFVGDVHPSAKFMAELSEEAYRKGNFEDVAYFEPYYLKDFVATTPRKPLV